MHNTARLLFR